MVCGDFLVWIDECDFVFIVFGVGWYWIIGFVGVYEWVGFVFFFFVVDGECWCGVCEE